MRIVLSVLLALGLASCGANNDIDTAIQKNLPKICASAATAHSAFIIVAATGDIKKSTVAKEAAAWAAVDTICKDPASVTTATALVKVAEAYAVLTVALREAKGA